MEKKMLKKSRKSEKFSTLFELMGNCGTCMNCGRTCGCGVNNPSFSNIYDVASYSAEAQYRDSYGY